MDFFDDKYISSRPTFANELVSKCEQSLDFRPMLFEWYKYVGIYCNRISCISPVSPALKKIQPVYYGILIGLLNRCSRLMLANTRLSSTRKYGETTRIIDRCISESAIKIQWLCKNDAFSSYLVDSLKPDLILKEQILKNISERGNKVQIIEKRMLKSIQRCIDQSGLTEEEVLAGKKLPRLNQMCEDLDYRDELYIGIQKMGSHSVHGTWSELLFSYLKRDESGAFYPRDHDVDTQDTQFISICLLVIDAMIAFLLYVTNESDERKKMVADLQSVKDQILEIKEQAWSSLFAEEGSL